MNSFPLTPQKAETVNLNNSTIYYEEYGEGEPLFLLHGYTWSSKAWHPFLTDYTDDFKVYLVDLKGHGKSGKFTEAINLKTVAREIDALTDYLNVDQLNAIGYSYGGETLFQLALIRPELIQSMIIIGSCGSWRAADFPDLVDYISYKNLDKLPWMVEQHTDDEQIRAILDQISNYNISVSDEEMKSIQTKTLFVLGDQDLATSFECILRARRNLQNSFLWVVPNTGHRAHTDNKEEFVRLSLEFFSTW